MKDRTQLETTVLDNGITIYAKPADVPFAYARLCLPVGHVHNTSDILPGSAHFLEHLTCKRSSLYPECDSYDKLIALKGGEFNASTANAWTSYTLKIPSDIFVSAYKGLISHALEPILDETDFQHEAGIISSERKRSSRWYPGSNELEHHCSTKWKHVYPLTLRQIFGEDPDLRMMSVENLKKLHQAYLDPRAYLIVGGNYDRDVVIKELSRFETTKHKLAEQCDPLRWVNREYHEEKFPDINRFLYHLGGIVEERDPQIFMGIVFIGVLLTNAVQGVLYDWLRRDLGWSYNMNFEFTRGHSRCKADWELWVPLSSYEQAQEVRKEVHERIQRAIRDEELLKREVERKLSAQVFWYQTVGSIMEEAENLLTAFGKFITETENKAMLEQCKDATFLQHIYEKYWSPDVVGEFLAIPEKA